MSNFYIISISVLFGQYLGMSDTICNLKQANVLIKQMKIHNVTN